MGLLSTKEPQISEQFLPFLITHDALVFLYQGGFLQLSKGVIYWVSNVAIIGVSCWVQSPLYRIRTIEVDDAESIDLHHSTDSGFSVSCGESDVISILKNCEHNRRNHAEHVWKLLLSSFCRSV